MHIEVVTRYNAIHFSRTCCFTDVFVQLRDGMTEVRAQLNGK